MAKYIHNSSGVEKTYLGVPMSNGSVREIPFEFYPHYAVLTDLVDDVAAGTVSISKDGTTPLSTSLGSIWLTTVYPAANGGFNNEGNSFDSTDIQAAIEEAATLPVGNETVIGATTTLVFNYNGGCSNKWLDSGHNSMPSDESPLTVPFDSRLIALTYTNSKEDSDTDIEIYRSAYGSGNSNSKIYTLELRNARTSVVRDISGATTFSVGDKVAVYCKDKGSNAKDVHIALYLQVTTESSGTLVEEWDGDF